MSFKDVPEFMISCLDAGPVWDTACNFEFMPGLVETERYEKELDLITFSASMPK